jgi:hypothetical protein
MFYYAILCYIVFFGNVILCYYICSLMFGKRRFQPYCFQVSESLMSKAHTASSHGCETPQPEIALTCGGKMWKIRFNMNPVLAVFAQETLETLLDFQSPRSFSNVGFHSSGITNGGRLHLFTVLKRGQHVATSGQSHE